MTLKNFEKKIPAHILDRGMDYFEMGNIEDVEALDSGEYSATVLGTDEYSVFLKFDHRGEVIEHSCNCPFDRGNFCKHVVAVLFYLKKGAESKLINESLLPELMVELEVLDKEELVDLFLHFSKRNKPLRDDLRRYFELDKDPGEQLFLF